MCRDLSLIRLVAVPRSPSVDLRAFVVSLLFGLVAPLVAFAVLSEKVVDKSAYRWDREILHLMSYLPRTPGNRTVELVTYAAMVLAALAPLGLIWRRRFREALFWALAIGGVVALDPLLKSTFKRPGVHEGSGYSFPSGSAMVSMAAALGIVFLARGRRLPLAFAGAVLVGCYGISLVRVEWHYPTDVLAGWSLSLAWVSALWFGLGARLPSERTNARRSGRSLGVGRAADG